MTANDQMPAASNGTASIIYAATGFFVGVAAENGSHQPHALPLRPGCYALHLASGKAGRINNKYRDESGTTYGIAYDSEFSGADLRRITPKQYKALPEECKIVSYETGIF